MQIPQKKKNRIEFIKDILEHTSQRKCMFCKYYTTNYIPKTLIKESIDFLVYHCHNCNVIRISMFSGKKKINLRDCFKPLYEWEEDIGE